MTGKNEKMLTGNELCGYLEHNGIVHEINRTFLHPLGLDLRVDQTNCQLELWLTEDPEGYLLDKINPMHKQVFQKLSSSKHAKRQATLGFGIQTKDMFRQENIRKTTGLFIAPERLKIELIMMCLSTFAHLIYRSIIENHGKKDSNLNVEQFSKEQLLRLMQVNINQEDWTDVAAYAMMLHQKEILQKGMEEIQEKAIEYNNYKLKQEDIK